MVGSVFLARRAVSMRVGFLSLAVLSLTACMFGGDLSSQQGEFEGMTGFASERVKEAYHNKNKGYYRVGPSYTIKGRRYVPKIDDSYDREGLASFYFKRQRTANGETFSGQKFTAAHPTLPIPTIVKVTNKRNGRSVEVLINDRGPYVSGRIIDLSKRAAQDLGFINSGVIPVRVQVLKLASDQARAIYRGKKIPALSKIDKIPVPEQKRGTFAPSAFEGDNVSSQATAQGVAATNAAIVPHAKPSVSGASKGTVTPKPIVTTAVSSTTATTAHLPSKKPSSAASKQTTQAKIRPQAKIVRTTALKKTVAKTKKVAPASQTSSQPKPAKEKAVDYAKAPTALIQNTAGPIGTARGRFVHVSTQSSYEGAAKVAAQMSRYGPSAVYPAKIGQRVVYRVRIGPFSGKAQAESVLKTVKANKYTGAQLVQD